MPASASARAAAVAWLATVASGCMPPSVRAVDGFLEGLEARDPDRVARWAHPADRALVKEGLAERRENPTGFLALALPPEPLEHEFIGIAHKSDDGARHVVQTVLTLKNPLPFASEKVGQPLEGVPETRALRKKFLSVRLDSGDWRVKLDLPAVVARAELVEAFQAALDAGRIAEAEALLDDVPPPPDEPSAVQARDRLAEGLRTELKRARLLRAATSSTAAEAAGSAAEEPANPAPGPAASPAEPSARSGRGSP